MLPYRAAPQQVGRRFAARVPEARLAVGAHMLVADDGCEREPVDVLECGCREFDLVERDGGCGARDTTEHDGQKRAHRARKLFRLRGVTPAVPAHRFGGCAMGGCIFIEHALQCDTSWKIVNL
ncbi:hypothetical protein [Microterricola viridarii]|uniref:hypothetical protein n=1 Tax=Microterricola viridarii TaxID=412690 RepID=UPI001F3BF0AC|nr:hypothetical protein [Microterricola viridarii]